MKFIPILIISLTIATHSFAADYTVSLNDRQEKGITYKAKQLGITNTQYVRRAIRGLGDDGAEDRISDKRRRIPESQVELLVVELIEPIESIAEATVNF